MYKTAQFSEHVTTPSNGITYEAPLKRTVVPTGSGGDNGQLRSTSGRYILMGSAGTGVGVGRRTATSKRESTMALEGEAVVTADTQR